MPADNRGLNYDAYFKQGQERVSTLDDFNSRNARQLGVGEMAEILSGLPYVRAFLDGGEPDAF